MIVLDKVDKYFGQKKALDNVSFKVKEGEIIGFVGPNGAGKTTTMRVIVGYLKPTLGKVLVDEKDPINDRIDVLKQIGYLAENNPLYLEMKVSEYLDFIASTKNNRESLTSLKKQTDVEEIWESKIEELSRGYKQRVGLAAAMVGNPKILILDEPTSGLDPIEQEKIRNLIKILGKKKTIILSTHILSEVENVATRVIIIDKGKIVYDGVKPKTKGGVERLFKKLVK
jgi:ABC-2 type transport system ATP-binding protein